MIESFKNYQSNIQPVSTNENSYYWIKKLIIDNYFYILMFVLTLFAIYSWDYGYFEYIYGILAL